MEKQIYFLLRIALIVIVLFHLRVPVSGQFVPVGNGGYTTVFHGVDQAGRNTYPKGTSKVSGLAVDAPIPIKDWWLAKLYSNHD